MTRESIFSEHAEFQARFFSPQTNSAKAAGVEIDSALQRALLNPILHPSIEESVFAGDRVAIAIQPNLPQSEKVVLSLLGFLSHLGLTAENIVVVVDERTAQALGMAPSDYRLPEETRADGPPPLVGVEFGFQTIDVQVHDPDNPAGLAYLAANAAGDPVYVNRQLVDADFVLSVGSPLPGETFASIKLRRHVDCIYPTFGGAAAHARFESGDVTPLALREESELANDMLGSFFIVQLVCGPGDKVTEILAGSRQQTADQARLATNEQWAFDFEGSAGAIVATIESDPLTQTWDNFADAVVFASRFISGAGPLIVWSDLTAKPNRLIRRACDDQFESGETAIRLPERYRLLASVLAERPVFLRSKVDQGVIESMGLGYLESVDEILRVTSGFEDGVLIRDAHRCQQVSLAED